MGYRGDPVPGQRLFWVGVTIAHVYSRSASDAAQICDEAAPQ